MNLIKKTFNVNNQCTEKEEQPIINRLSSTPNRLYLEPSITLRGGWKYFKIQHQVVLDAQISPAMKDQDVNISKEVMSFGIQWMVAEQFWRKKTHRQIIED